ncbi:hypothetical protein MARHY2921 [Marinobacter nauticus ATCC 49840]|nr:hypothetical protein MARHY2921 [Marinobacter nauticus ATCC 49840]
MLSTPRKVRSELVTRECSGSASLQVFLARINGGSEVIHFRDVSGLGFFDHSQAGSKYLTRILITARGNQVIDYLGLMVREHYVSRRHESHPVSAGLA